MTSANYNDDAIVTDTGLDIVRRRPTQYLPDMEHAGISHMIVELEDNSCDEATLMGAAGRVDVVLCPDPKRNTFQCIVRDNGRGIPLAKLVVSYTQLHTSGKYSTATYLYSAGLFGVGGKVAAGLSERFRAISARDKEGTASILIKRGKHPDTATFEKGIKGTGMTVCCEPDGTVMRGVDTYIEGGWGDLLERIKKYAYFHESQIRLLIAEGPLPSSIWTAGNIDAITMANAAVDAAQVIFDSTTFNREEWLRRYLGVNRPFSWSHTVSKVPDNASTMAYTVQLLYSEKEFGYNRFGMINSVPIDIATSHHLSEVIGAVNDRIEHLIPSKDVKAFFRDSYKTPIYLAVDVKYEGAEFTGTTKHSFTNADFRREYGGYLRDHFARGAGKEAIAELYALIAEDIQEKYLISITGQVKIKVQGRLWQDLNFPKKFEDCDTKDRTRAELFLVEGDSAGGGIKDVRDGETQGLYILRGKPFNALKKSDSLESASIAAQTDPIYRDIIRILGLDVRNPNLETMYFSRILILADADPDGVHIGSTLIGNMYAICPPLVESGRIQIVAPPYYGVSYVGQRSSKKKQYITDKASLVHWFTQHVYKPALDVTVSFEHPNVKSGKPSKSTIKLDGVEYDSFVQRVMEVGDLIYSLAKELVIDPLILEMLTHVSQYLAPEWVNVDHIKSTLNLDKVLYDPNGHILTLSIGRDDFTIPLYRVTERLYEGLIPMLSALHWRKLEIYITSKNHDGLKEQWMTIGQFYGILKSFDSLFHIKQFKGLGSMDPDDCYTVCMDPNHRTVYPITSISDAGLISDLLGKDSTHRKKLLVGQMTVA